MSTSTASVDESDATVLKARRLLHAVGDPPRVFTNHFDDWRAPPVDAPLDDDLRDFLAEVRACAPATVATVPGHFQSVTIP